MLGTVRYFDGTSWTQHVAPVAPVGVARSHSAAPGVGASPTDPVHWLVPTGRSWQSIAGGYVALFALVIWVLGPIALGLGLWALRVSEATGTHGRGRAVFAVVVGSLATLAMLATVVAMIA